MARYGEVEDVRCEVFGRPDGGALFESLLAA
jgi:hypothetical protein